MLGTWKSNTNSFDSRVRYIKTLVIDNIEGENFRGTKTNEITGRGHAKIVTAISGHLSEDNFYIQTGAILYKKDPSDGKWWDCSSCTPKNKIYIHGDSVILSNLISGCQKDCDGISFYYRLLCEYDTVTQRHLVSAFGNSSDITTFKPCIEEPKNIIASDTNKAVPVTLTAAAMRKRQQQIEDSTKNVAMLAKKRQQAIEDSLNTVAKTTQKQQQQINDSLNIAKQKEQKRVQDSLTTAVAITKKQQQQIEDSTHYAALLAIRKQKAIDDSLNQATRVTQKRQQQINDSLKIVTQREQKRLKDSLKTADMLVQKKQKAINDSLNAVAKIRQQQTNDSLKRVAAVAAAKPPEIKDSVKASTSKALAQRNNVLLETYHINTPDILIEIFDNAQIDGDRVSVFHNKNLIVSNQMLQKEPITFKIHADPSNREHEFIMIAENLGTIPPNTALMRITAGNQTYKLSVRTDMQNNAKIVFYYDGGQ